ncbi:MAG: excinuclease ABC subunit UvrC [Chloroflexi bacterium]|nr:excinuclease ABC subunit UvrC [Chloroflexota bacterium]
MTTNSSEETRFSSRLGALPARPGVYVLKNQAGQIIYVGKALSLRHRLRSYFHADARLSPKARKMISQIADFEYFVTASEKEALILECNLIKRHHPYYNIRLRDDKNYLYIKIAIQEDWPRVYTVRRPQPDVARYFGPYSSAKSLRATLDLLKKLFPYRSCRKEITGKDKRPCLEYHIRRCLGPCIGATTRLEYGAVIQQVCSFLDGNHEQIVSALRRNMEAAAESLNFESAAHFRDQRLAVQKVVEKQKVISVEPTDQDVIAAARSNGEACVMVFFIRNGKLIGREHFVMQGTEESERSEILSSFVQQFYADATHVPAEVILQDRLGDAEVLAAWLGDRRGDRVRLAFPQRGKKRQLVQMVEENAGETLEQLRLQWLSDAAKTGTALVELQENLGLPTLPIRIECYDVSNVQGTSAVGSMVVFEKGMPQPSQYRRFRIKTVEGANDYAMLQEVLRRRFRRYAARQKEAEEAPAVAPGGEAKDSWGIAPHLVIVDGGRGQLSAALEVMDELAIYDLPVAGLAKEHEALFLPDTPDPVILPRTSQSLYLVQRIRDEAHRFALSYHQRVRARTTFGSVLDQVPGIGAQRKGALLRRFGSLKGIQEASIEDLALVPGMNRRLAERLKDQL